MFYILDVMSHISQKKLSYKSVNIRWRNVIHDTAITTFTTITTAVITTLLALLYCTSIIALTINANTTTTTTWK